MKALRSTVLFFAICAASFFATPNIAFAEDDATIEAARERFKEGVEFFDNKEYERARLAFVQAYALKPHPAVLLNLAQSELRSGHEAEAATHFTKYLREHAEATEEQRDAAREGLEKAKESIGIVTLTVSESGAEVSVDGESVGSTPLDDPLYLSPGEHTIVAQKGGETARTTVSVEAGSATSENLKLGGAPPAAAPAAAAEASSEEGEADEEYSAEMDAEDVGSGGPLWEVSEPVVWVGAGLSVAALGTGAVLAISAKNYYSSADKIAGDIEQEANDRGLETAGICNLPWGEPPYENDPGFKNACKRYKDRVDTADNYKKYATISFIAGGVFAVGTLVYALVPELQGGSARSAKPNSASTDGVRVQVVPVVGPGQNGLVVLGSF